VCRCSDSATSQFTEQKPSPQDADQGVRIPERKRNGQADITDGKHRQCIRDGPKGASNDAPDDEVSFVERVLQDKARALH